jgi:O-antigen ligase
MLRARQSPWAVVLALPPRLVLPPLLVGSSGVLIALLVAVLGLWAIAVPFYAAAFALAVLRPDRAAMTVLLLLVVVEPGAIDFTRGVSMAVWEMPPGLEHSLGFTTSPMELFILAATASSVVQIRSRLSLPLVVWAFPLAVGAGMLHGIAAGGAPHLAYNEGRGLLIGIAAFVLFARTLPRDLVTFAKVTMFAEALLAAEILLRYVVYVRGGELTVPLEFAFTHEGSLVLGVGLLIGLVTLVEKRHAASTRLLLVAYALLLSLAMAATGRRAATLVLITGVVTLALLWFPRRPKLVIAAALPLALLAGVYLSVYWNKEYGAIAQPARAVRSQIDPSARDESSDVYRDIEKFDVVATIRGNRLLGVGFGRRFAQYQPLPDLERFWTLQFYTPHENVLWLWLKLGLPGIGVCVGVWLVALKRCLVAWHDAACGFRHEIAAVAFGTILMFVIYSTIDLGFVGVRSVVLFVAVLAFALSLREGKEGVDGGGAPI